MPDLSVLIPARQEQFLARTIADVLEHSRGDTEIIAVLDGAWAEPPIPDHPRVTLVKLGASIGQRAATNLAARLASGRYIAKLDAHCSVAEGWDVELVRAGDELGHDVTQIPAQKNLHVYSWRCNACKAEQYQGPDLSQCPSCKATGQMERVIYWQTRKGTTTTSWVFDSTLHFQYDKAGQRRQKDDICDVMTSLGACFVMRRERFWELGGLDEATGSWGNFGVEIACKSWLSGGRHVVNKATHFSHFFRVGGIGFCYPITGAEQEGAREYSRRIWRSNAWPGQTRPLRWLLEKFWPVTGWTEADRDALPQNLPAARAKAVPTVGLVYYTHQQGDPAILQAVRDQLQRSVNGYPIAAVQTGHPRLADGFGTTRISLDLEPGILTMFKQILAGLEALDTEFAFLVEHDCLYSPHQFQFRPPRRDTYYYQINTWKVDAVTGRAVTYETKQTSQLCADRQLLIAHYRERVARVERDGFSRAMGFEPGSHRRPERIDDVPSDVWRSPVPNIDVRHSANLTASRWSPQEFRSQRNCRGWQEADGVPGWGQTKGRFAEFLRDVPSLFHVESITRR